MNDLANWYVAPVRRGIKGDAAFISHPSKLKNASCYDVDDLFSSEWIVRDSKSMSIDGWPMSIFQLGISCEFKSWLIQNLTKRLGVVFSTFDRTLEIPSDHNYAQEELYCRVLLFESKDDWTLYQLSWPNKDDAFEYFRCRSTSRLDKLIK